MTTNRHVWNRKKNVIQFLLYVAENMRMPPVIASGNTDLSLYNGLGVDLPNVFSI